MPSEAAILPPDPADAAPGRLEGVRPVAIIDIGSNTVRLVIYEGRTRAPTPLYNEKLFCGLGRDLATTGRLPTDAVERALTAIRRFRLLCETNRVESLRVLATAAARVAENGPDFLRAAEAAAGRPVELLTGEREATLSALGVISGWHDPDGVVGDLGGGSLELVDVRGTQIGRGITLPLGGLVLKDRAGGAPKNAVRIAGEELARATQLKALQGRTFYAVGGTWRALARMQMEERGYPLHVLHGYQFELGQTSFRRVVERTSAPALKAVASVTESRRPLLVYGAIVLDEIVRAGKPAGITVSALGVREGLLFSDLSASEQALDPLIAAARELNVLRARAPRHAEELIAWTDAFLASLGQPESADERRLRHAACFLSDTGWRAHPDYRGQQSLAMIAYASLLGVSHAERAFLALAIYFRHEGVAPDRTSEPLTRLAGPRLTTLARLCAALFRVAYPITAAMTGILSRTPLKAERGQLVLDLPADLADLASERLAGRVRALGKLIDRDVSVRID